MKKILLATALFTVALVTNQSASAQVRVNVNVNIGDQPRWRAPGYDYVEYYYLPDIETYYYVPTRQFIYLSNGNWVFGASLPVRYRSYDLYSGYKVVINERNAYNFYHTHRIKYPKKHVFVNKGGFHSDNGNHNGWYKNKGKGKKGRH